MDEKRMDLLVNSGRCAMTAYLKGQQLALK
jgi:hypothetical protein